MDDCLICIGKTSRGINIISDTMVNNTKSRSGKMCLCFHNTGHLIIRHFIYLALFKTHKDALQKSHLTNTVVQEIKTILHSDWQSYDLKRWVLRVVDCLIRYDDTLMVRSSLKCD